MSTLFSVIFFASSALAVNVYDGLNVSGLIRFSDGTTQNTANLTGPIGPQGIEGPVGPAGPAGPSGSAAMRYAWIAIPSDGVNMWHSSDIWDSLVVPHELIVLNEGALVKFDLNFNVGTYGPNWCTVGLYIDDMNTPACEMSWSGVSGTTMFNNQVMSCISGPLTAGTHIFSYGHKSQYCHYFNAPNLNTVSNFIYLLEMPY
jgi:hypothetical protein